MVDWSNPDYARSALADPRLPAAELAAIAAVQPGLWPQVAAHPAAYPDLLAWLAAQGVPVPPRYPAPVQQPPQTMPVATAPQYPQSGQPAPVPTGCCWRSVRTTLRPSIPTALAEANRFLALGGVPIARE